ncbi:MAG: SCO family protein [Planctomycetes bacterium]|nr:SCO family protein [Planctomycetota bacterium]
MRSRSAHGRAFRARASVLVLAAVAGTAATNACSQGDAPATLEARAEAPDRFGTLAEFRLVDSAAHEVTRRDLEGRVWIVSFVFTTCTGPCPTIVENLRRLQPELPAEGVGLLSVSVDPATDTPAVLAEYARGLGADTTRWRFLTGDSAEIDALLRSSFSLPIERAAPGTAPVGEHVAHSTKLVVVDRDGRIAGYYSGTEIGGARAALERARWLGGVNE